MQMAKSGLQCTAMAKHFEAFAIRLNLNQFSFNLGKCLSELKQAQNENANSPAGKAKKDKNAKNLLKW